MSVLSSIKNKNIGSIRKRPPTNIDLYLSVKLTDRDGRCVYQRKYRSRSFVVGFLGALNNLLTTCGSSYPVGIGNFKIVVGNGTGKASVGDGGLVSQIGNGTGSGQLEYGSVTQYSVTVNTSTNTAYFQVQQPFVNGSGASVTVTEVGLNYVQAQSGVTPATFFVAHDFLPQSISVGANQTLTVTYTVQVAT